MTNEPHSQSPPETASELDERTLVAYHEAAHAAVGYVLGHVASVVSIAPSLRWRGVYFHRAPTIDESCLDGLRPREAPLAMQPPELRANLEARILVSLAGPAGEDLYVQRAGFTGCRRVEEHDRATARETASKFALTDAQRELLARGDDPRGTSRRDNVAARAWAELLVAEEEVDAYLGWLERSARRLVQGARVVRLVEALVPVLLARERVPGEAVADLFRRTERLGRRVASTSATRTERNNGNAW